MDPRTRNTIGPVTTSTLNIALRVLAYLEERGTPLPRHPDPAYPFPVIWGKGSSSEHATGRALDFMVPNHRAIGDAIADYLWDHRHEFGLVWVIWRQRIRSTAGNGQWRWMEDRGSVTENHYDHPHALFSGKYVSPPAAASTKPAAKPTPVDAKALRRRWLKTDLVVDGKWGANTTRRVQAHVNAPITGKLDKTTWSYIQRWLGVTRDGVPGPQTYKALQRKVGATADGRLDPLTIRALQKWMNEHQW